MSVTNEHPAVSYRYERNTQDACEMLSVGAVDATRPPKAKGCIDASDRGVADIVDRAKLINIAYRMLGSMSDAEDVVQETYLRWCKLTAEQRSAIRTPAAWRVRVATRICLDILDSARNRREQYVGEWIPEPIPGQRTSAAVDISCDPADWIAIDESVTMAMMVVLDSMTPAERVSFVLHDVFQYSFAEIANIVGRSAAACRQLAASARRRVKPALSNPSDEKKHTDMATELRRALHRGDVATLVALLDPEVTVVNDGGGRVRAALRPIVGASKVIRYMMGVRRRDLAVDISVAYVNGQAGLRIKRGSITAAVVAIDVRDGLIRRIWIVRNTDKLRPWNHIDGA